MTAMESADLGELTDVWIAVCKSDQLRPNRGVCALVEGIQVALFRTGDGGLYAVDNTDPCSGTNVISRGLVGSLGDVWIVASPMYKQRFELSTGVCIDDPTKGLAVHHVAEFKGCIFVMIGERVEFDNGPLRE
jgi:nitrite reductase (NADH) small subunit